jgi:hypothetical protein
LPDGPPAEIVTACVYWVLKKEGSGGWLLKDEVLARVREMTPAEIREARALHAEAVQAGDA